MEIEYEWIALEELFSEGDNVFAVAQEALDEQLGVISQVKQALDSEGASRQTMLTLESFIEGSLPERYPINSFTVEPSKTNLNIALESVVEATMKALKKFIDTILKWFNKAIDAFLKFFGRKGNDNEDRKEEETKIAAKREELDKEFTELVADGEVQEYNPATADVKVRDDKKQKALYARYDELGKHISELLIRIDRAKPHEDLLLGAMYQVNNAVTAGIGYMKELGDSLNAFRQSRDMQSMQAVITTIEQTDFKHDFSEYAEVFKLITDDPVPYDEVFENTVRDLVGKVRKMIKDGYSTSDMHSSPVIASLLSNDIKLKGISKDARAIMTKGYQDFKDKTRDTQRVGVVMKGKDKAYDEVAKRYSEAVSTTLRKMQKTSMLTMNLYTLAVLISDHMFNFTKAKRRFFIETDKIRKTFK